MGEAEGAIAAYNAELENARIAEGDVEAATAQHETAVASLDAALVALNTVMADSGSTAEEVAAALATWTGAVSGAASAQGLLETATRNANSQIKQQIQLTDAQAAAANNTTGIPLNVLDALSRRGPGGADPAKAGETDYFEGKYSQIRDGVARHEARMIDQAATAARAAAAAPVTAPELSDRAFDLLLEQGTPSPPSSPPPVSRPPPDRPPVLTQFETAPEPPVTVKELSDKAFDLLLEQMTAPITAPIQELSDKAFDLLLEQMTAPIIPIGNLVNRIRTAPEIPTVVVQGSIIDTEGLVQAVGEGAVQLDRRGRQRVLGR